MGGSPQYKTPEGAWLAQYVLARFGRQTDVVEGNPTLTATVTKVLKGNPRRLFWCIFNLGTVDVFGGFNMQVSTTNGWRVQAGGGFASASADEDGELVGREVDMVSSSGTQQLYTLEVLGV